MDLTDLITIIEEDVKAHKRLFNKLFMCPTCKFIIFSFDTSTNFFIDCESGHSIYGNIIIDNDNVVLTMRGARISFKLTDYSQFEIANALESIIDTVSMIEIQKTLL
jgi:hypothetical protein